MCSLLRIPHTQQYGGVEWSLTSTLPQRAASNRAVPAGVLQFTSNPESSSSLTTALEDKHVH